MKLDYKNLGWLVSTIMDRLAYIVIIHDIVVVSKGNEIPMTWIWNHTGTTAVILVGWVWSLWRNGTQPSIIPYLKKWNDKRMARIRKKRIIFINSREEKVFRKAK